MSRIALDHRIGWLKAGVGYLCHGKLLVVSLLSRDDSSVGNKREVNSWIWDQIGLELIQINVQSPVKPKGGSDRGDDLRNQPVQVGVGRTLNIQIPSTNIVDCLIIDHEGTITVPQGCVGTQCRVVWLYNSGSHLRGRIDGKLELGLLSIIHREPFHQQRSES